MQLTHARENRLPSVLVRLDTESGILGDEALERSAHLFLVGLGVRLDRHRDNGLGKGRRLQTDVEVFVTQRIASDDVFNANDGTDVTRIGHVDFLALDRTHQDEAGNALGATGARIIQGHSPWERAGVDAEKDEATHERVVPKLEGESGEFGLVVDDGLDGFSVGVQALHRRNVDRARQEVNDAIKQALNTFFLVG